MKADHTRGPWVAKGSDINVSTWVVDKNGKRVCTMSPREMDWDFCKLIAAAPELLEALQDLVKDILANPTDIRSLNRAQEVIKKATE